MRKRKVIAIIHSKNGVPIRLTEERWEHIIASHADMKDNRKLVLETIREPDMILRGATDELRAIKFFSETHLGPKYIMVAYKELSEKDGFIVTAYKTSRIDKIVKRGVIWSKRR